MAPYVSVPLSHVFNLTFTTGKIPNDLKVALITPVYKASEKNVFSNYRPISVLPFFSKILEKLMYERLINSQAAQTLFVIYIRDSIALRFKPFKRMYENGSKIALNSTCSKGFK